LRDLRGCPDAPARQFHSEQAEMGPVAQRGFDRIGRGLSFGTDAKPVALEDDAQAGPGRCVVCDEHARMRNVPPPASRRCLRLAAPAAGRDWLYAVPNNRIMLRSPCLRHTHLPLPQSRNGSNITLARRRGLMSFAALRPVSEIFA